MPDFIEVVIDSVRVSLMSAQRIVVLRQKDAERYLPIPVGPFEAEAITIALQEVEVIRPLTHDLLRNVFQLFDVRILRIEISALKADIYYGNIVAEGNGKVYNIDARSSDAIALAVRAHAPILVGSSVMDTAGITPEKDLEEQPDLPPVEEPPPPPGATQAGEDRLSVFEDFLKGLDPDEDRPEKGV